MLGKCAFKDQWRDDRILPVVFWEFGIPWFRWARRSPVRVSGRAESGGSQLERRKWSSRFENPKMHVGVNYPLTQLIT